MAKTYLEKFYFPLHASLVKGDFLTRNLTDEEIIECLPHVQKQIDAIQQDSIVPNDMGDHLNGIMGFRKVISATWGVTHRYGVPYGIVRVRCAEPIDVYERNQMRLLVGFINEDGFWSNFKDYTIECGDKAIEVSLFHDSFDDVYYVHTQSLMYLKWKRKKKTKKWRDAE